MAALNFFRWVRENWFAWGLLGGMYLFLFWFGIVDVLMEVDPDWTQRPESRLRAIVLVAVPFLCHRFLDFQIPIRGDIFNIIPSQSISSLIVKHQLRRLGFWVVLLVSAILLITPGNPWFKAVFSALLPIQYLLFGVERWRRAVVFFEPVHGAGGIWKGVFQVSMISGGMLGVILFAIHSDYKLVFGVLGASMSAAWVSMEGDAGRPGLSHLFSLSAGILGGVLMWISPFLILLIAYAARTAGRLAQDRHQSVEFVSEDDVVS